MKNCDSVVRIPSHTRQKITRYKKIVERLSQEYDRIPTDKEVADYMHMDVPDIQKIKGYMQGVSSLDTPLYEDAYTTIGENV